ncbi:casein kinase 1, delta [Tritrichomonas foetus]|uniref:Casein kinase 1, delta n=1 Tax=Tritrichomonas foetus TaxID=1144522 RepID=A0A1J4K9I0_9EUKA|nr:casein kinase 1, delta [Tritrichomonas foetus]|eukprot:OHT06356.1 casein kinase 1, delta [Tritrichomonas foetus]
MSFCSNISYFKVTAPFPHNKQMFYGVNEVTKEEVLFKTSKKEMRIEAKICSTLSGTEGFPDFYHYGIKNGRCIMVTQLLGKTLKQLFVESKLHFSLKTVLMIADQMLRRLEYLHTRGIVHGRIDLNHIMVNKKSDNILYLVDFEHAILVNDVKSSVSKVAKKMDIENVKNKDFLSLNAMGHQELGFKDDLESLGYVLIYLMKNTLPWANCANMFDVKCSTLAKDLCAGLPKEFLNYMISVKNLSQFETPNYSGYRENFKKLFMQFRYVFDHQFDWNQKKEISFHFYRMDSSKNQRIHNQNVDNSNINQQSAIVNQPKSNITPSKKMNIFLHPNNKASSGQHTRGNSYGSKGSFFSVHNDIKTMQPSHQYYGQPAKRVNSFGLFKNNIKVSSS